MVWSKSAKSGAKGGGGEHVAGKGKGTGGRTAAQGSNQSNQKETLAQIIKGNRVLTATVGKLESMLSKVLHSSAPKEPKKETNKQWFCLAADCGFAKNFGHRTECFKCKAPKRMPPSLSAGAVRPGVTAVAAAGQAAGVKQEPTEKEAASMMDTEVVPVETRIARLETELKVLRLGTLPESEALAVSYEQAPKSAREEQRLARPLPARFQAATDKATKSKLLQAELANKTGALQEHRETAAKAFSEKSETVAKEAAENEAKLAEAEHERATVKVDLAAEQAVPAAVVASPLVVARICDLLFQKV